MHRDWRDELENYSVDPDKYLDVPFVPTDEAVVEALLDLADVGSRDLVYDLGSGDGRILIAAARDRSARGVGVEIDPVRIAEAMEYAGWAGVETLVDFVEDDIFNADISPANVIVLYLLESVNARLRPRLLSELSPGTRIVSHAFDMGDWQADERIRLAGTNLYKWIVPARVAGVWQWRRRDGKLYRLELQQKYQEVCGSVQLDGKKAHLIRAELNGNHLMLSLAEDPAMLPDLFTMNFSRKPRPSVIARN